MENKGDALIGIGVASGENRAIEAARQSVSSPLLETDIRGATDAIVNITGGNSLGLFEVQNAVEVIRQASGTDINIIFGAVINESLEDDVIVTVVATGFDKVGDAYMDTLHEQVIEMNSPISNDSDDEDDGWDIPDFIRNRKNL